MAPKKDIDVLENTLRKQGRLLDILLLDHTTKKNILWATDSYSLQQSGYKAFKSKSQIRPELVTGELYGNFIQPRAVKSLEEQKRRTKDKAEVFTPLHIVSSMNKQVDWDLGYPTKESNWKEYVRQLRLEITCGEAPFIAGRYNPEAHTGKKIELYTRRGRPNRVGFLDRKLYEVTKYCEKHKDWVFWAKESYKASYGYEWQGDNLLIARENLLYTFIDFYEHKFNKKPSVKLQEEFAQIISWNIFQMDGLKYVVPMSCHHETKTTLGQPTLLNGMEPVIGVEPDIVEKYECEGCKFNRPSAHNGKYVRIMDWSINKKLKFVDLTAN